MGSDGVCGPECAFRRTVCSANFCGILPLFYRAHSVQFHSVGTRSRSGHGVPISTEHWRRIN